MNDVIKTIYERHTILTISPYFADISFRFADHFLPGPDKARALISWPLLQ
jgi:hypothetical protein